MAVMVTAILLIFSGVMVHQQLSGSLLDIKDTPYHTSFAYLLSRGIIDGYPDKTGRPYGYINRVEVMKTLVNAREELQREVPIVAADLPPFPLFIDTYQDQWYAPYLELGFREDITTGYPDGSFRPGQLVRVEEAVALLTRAFNVRNNTNGVEASDFIENRPNEWFTLPINAAVSKNLVQHQSNLKLGTAMTRGQFFDMLYRLHLIENLDLVAYNGPEPFEQLPDLNAPVVENVVVDLDFNNSSPVAAEYDGDNETATEVADPPLLANNGGSSTTIDSNNDGGSSSTTIDSSNNGGGSSATIDSNNNNGGGSSATIDSNNNGGGSSTTIDSSNNGGGSSVTIGSGDPPPESIIFDPNLPIEYVADHPEKSYLPYAMNLPTIGIRNLPVLRPANVTSRAGLEEVLDRGIGAIMSPPGGGGNEFNFGHSSAYNATPFSEIFREIANMAPGDLYYVTYKGILFEYQVTHHNIIEAADTSVYRDTGEPRSILYTCHPPGGFSHRYVIYGVPTKAYVFR
jgi:LPXTG-site transpeptidase (sortase) family protein